MSFPWAPERVVVPRLSQQLELSGNAAGRETLDV